MSKLKHLKDQFHCGLGLYLQRWFSEEEWAQLEDAVSCAKVVKVKVIVWASDQGSRARGFTVLAAGLVKNKALKEVELYGVPKNAKKSVR